MADLTTAPRTAPLGPFTQPTVERLTTGLGISADAAALYLASDVIDGHIESFSFHRSLGYDLRQRHELGVKRGLFFGHADFPRVLEAGLCGGTWVISTNPVQPSEARGAVFSQNLRALIGLFEQVPEHFSVVKTATEYAAARAQGRHAAFLGVQGGNAFDHDLGELERAGDHLLRVTLLHLTNSRIGVTSSPLRHLRGDAGLTDFGRDFVRALNARRIGVDLAHVNERGFWDAVNVHDRSQPLWVTHTGVSGVHRCWRNIDDRQLRAIADSGGLIGVMYHSEFLGDRLRAGRLESVARHLEHIVRTVGDDFAALGSDWDGAIDTPRDMPSCLELPRLVELLLRRGMPERSVQKLLGENYLRVVRHLKGS